MWCHVSKACREERWHSADNGCDTVLNGAGVLGEVTNLTLMVKVIVLSISEAVVGGWACGNGCENAKVILAAINYC